MCNMCVYASHLYIMVTTLYIYIFSNIFITAVMVCVAFLVITIFSLRTLFGPTAIHIPSLLVLLLNFNNQTNHLFDAIRSQKQFFVTSCLKYYAVDFLKFTKTTNEILVNSQLADISFMILQ